MMNMKKGFTLAELLVVIVIIAVLAALIIPRYIIQSEKGIVAEAVAHLSAIRQAEASWMLEYSTYTTTIGSLDLDVTSTKFTYTVTAGTGLTTALRSGGGSCSATNFGNCTITLTAGGTWGGTHPFAPTNPT